MRGRRLGICGWVVAWAVLGALTLPLAVSRGAVRPQAGGRLPLLPTLVGVGVGRLKVRPADISYTEDSSGVLSGPTPGSKLHWRSWSSQRAFGGGYDLVDNCRPNCAQGHYGAYPVQIEAWKPGVLKGELVFSRVTILFTGKLPPGQSGHYTFTTSYVNGWELSPPGIVGYCKDTHGQPVAPGCGDTTELPPGLSASAQRSAAGQASR